MSEVDISVTTGGLCHRVLVVAPRARARALHSALRTLPTVQANLAPTASEAVRLAAHTRYAALVWGPDPTEQDTAAQLHQLVTDPANDGLILILGAQAASLVAGQTHALVHVSPDPLDPHGLVPLLRSALQVRTMERDLAERRTEAEALEALTCLQISASNGQEDLQQAARLIARLPRVALTVIVHPGQRRVYCAAPASADPPLNQSELEAAAWALVGRRARRGRGGHVVTSSVSRLRGPARRAASTLELRSLARVPLVLDDGSTGELLLGSTTGEPYSSRRLARIRDVANHLTGLLQRLQFCPLQRERDGSLQRLANLPREADPAPPTAMRVVSTALQESLLREQRTEARLEAAQRRLSFLVESSSILGASLDYESTLQAVTRFAVPELADYCLLLLKDPAGKLRSVQATHPEPIMQQLAASLGTYAASQALMQAHLDEVMRTGRAIIVGRLSDPRPELALPDLQHHHSTETPGMQSALILPLMARGHALGAILLASVTAERYSHADLLMAVELARRTAQAVDNARLYQSVVDAERGLRYQLDFTATLTTSLGEGLVAADRDLRVRHLNPAAARMLDLDEDAWYGADALDILPLATAEGELIPVQQHPLTLAMEEQRVITAQDVALLRAGGARMPLAYTASPHIVGNRVTGVVLALRDTTERKRAEEADVQLRQAASLTAVGLLGSSVIHDLFQPVTAMTAMIEVLSEEERLSPHGRELVTRLHRTLRRLGDTTLNLRRFMRASNDETSDIDLQQICDDALALFEHELRLRTVEIVRVHRPDTPRARGNATELEQVLVNLLANARDAMQGQPGRVTVMTERDTSLEGAARVALRVQDNGSGIPTALVSRVFEPLFTTKERGAGTGLGLAICKRIVDHMGGSIELESEEGVGTRVSVLLPAAEGWRGRTDACPGLPPA